jgi:antitoxin FitA
MRHRRVLSVFVRGNSTGTFSAGYQLIAMSPMIPLQALLVESFTVASITIRNLDDDLKRRLRIRAAERGRSMEEEARDILRQVVAESSPPRDLAAAIRRRVAPVGGVDIDVPPREPMRDSPRFDHQRE